jgi:hypothetical protein
MLSSGSLLFMVSKLISYLGEPSQVKNTLDYKRTQKVMAECPFCLNDDSAPAGLPMIALGGRVYLSCTLHEELVEGHCLIVPIQHHLNMLEGDDDVWDEVQVCSFALACSTSECSAEFHEMPHSHVRRGRQGGDILRDGA